MKTFRFLSAALPLFLGFCVGVLASDSRPIDVGKFRVWVVQTDDDVFCSIIRTGATAKAILLVPSLREHVCELVLVSTNATRTNVIKSVKYGQQSRNLPKVTRPTHGLSSREVLGDEKIAANRYAADGNAIPLARLREAFPQAPAGSYTLLVRPYIYERLTSGDESIARLLPIPEVEVPGIRLE
jgi:hypothetical protein